MAIFDNKGANAALLAGLGLMGPRPFAGAQQGLMMAGQIGAQQAANKRAEAQAQRQQAQFEQAQQREQAMHDILAGGGISGAPGPQYAAAGTQPAPGAPINLLPTGGAGGASIPAQSPLLAGLNVNQQQAANLARLGSGALPIIQMMQAQRERQAKLNAPQKPPTGMRQMPDGSWAYDPNYLQGQERLKQAGRTSVTQRVDQGGGLQLTPGQEELDTTFVKEVYQPFVLAGGSADAERNLSTIEETIRRINEADDVTGTLAARLPDSIRTIFDQEGLGIQQRVEQVVQRDLRQVLGGQFAQQEGEQLIRRAYNPALSDEENAKRLRALYQAMAKGYKDRVRAAQHFEDRGTMQGYRGSYGTSIADLNRVLDDFDLRSADIGGANQATGAPAGQNAPEIGTKDGGYVFQGGNPADPNNWTRAQ